MENENKIPSVVKDLAEAASKQTEVANKYWIYMAIICLFVLIPKPIGLEKNSLLKLPLDLGEVETRYYYLVLLILVSVLTISFCSAHAQVIRVQFLFDRAIDRYKLIENNMYKLHPRDLFDVLRLPALSRVAPLALIARGEKQFYTDAIVITKARKILTGIYYILLKILSFSIYVGLPVFTLVFGMYKYNLYSTSINVEPILYYALWIFSGGAFITLLHVIINEIWYFKKVISILFK